jgi:hypothetical protein
VTFRVNFTCTKFNVVVHRTRDQLVLFPIPSSDPNDPLNWSTARKILNFTLVSFFVLWTFVQLDIGEWISLHALELC